MKCSRCGHEDTKVLESRLSNEGKCVRRRRSCLACNYRFTTYEMEEEFSLQVLKKNNSYDEFSREKLIRSIATACRKRKIPIERIEQIVVEIESQLKTEGERTVPSTRIGDLVMAKLYQTDAVAYVRFASIYKDFKDPNEFMRELQALQQDKGSKVRPATPGSTLPH